MTRASRFNEIVKAISVRTGCGMSETSKVLNAYIKHLASTMDKPLPVTEDLLFGIMKLDGIMRLHPGMTLVYSESDVGKTSFLKTMSMNLVKQGQTVLYVDAECKLYLHQLDSLDGVYFSILREDTDMFAIRDFIDTGLVDVVLVDTVSSMPHNTLKAFLFTTKKKVPFVILAAQMRVDFEKKKKRPACSDSILSGSHTHIYLTESEKISFESVDMKRVQFSITKSEANHDIVGVRSSFVVFNNMVSNFWSSVDYLHSIGIIRAHGRDKYMDGRNIGLYRDIVDDEKAVSMITSMAWKNLSDKEADHGVFLESCGALWGVQAEGSEDGEDYIPAGQEELTDTYSC